MFTFRDEGCDSGSMDSDRRLPDADSMNAVRYCVTGHASISSETVTIE